MSLYGGSLSVGSIKTYTTNLKNLNNKVVPTDIKFLKKTDTILEKIKGIENPNTRRSYYIAVVTALKDQPKYKKEYDLYHAEMMNINKELNKESYKSESTKEKHTKVNMPDLFTRYEHLYKIMGEISKKKKILPDQYERLCDLVVASLYLLIAPRRLLDYTAMVVDKPSENKDLNYYHDGKFYFNNYKTKNAFNQQIIDLPKKLQDILKVWLRFKPKEDNHLLLKIMRSTPYTIQDLARSIKKAFDNSSIGVSVLRGEYLKNKYGSLTKDLQQDATNMGTSVGVINGTYMKD